jgi:hypothetical protein
MLKTITIAGCFCGILAVSVSASASTHRPARRHSATTKASAAQSAPTPVTPAVPEPPPTPEQMPAAAPRVVLSDGLLSILAENSTLGDVLNAVKNLTGATVEAPTTANNQRIAVNLGPGNPQQVLQELLSGSKFDYMILGSPTNATTIEKIIISNRGAGGSSGPPPNNGMSRMPAQPVYEPPSMPDQNDNAVDDEIVQPEPPPPQQEEVTPPQEEQRQIGPGGEAQQGPKTPEQLLQELQRMQREGRMPNPQR